MIERVVSSMNSTRTWVTPPREPEEDHYVSIQCPYSTGATSCVELEEAGWLCREGKRGRVVPVRPNTLVTLTSLTGTLPESIIAAFPHFPYKDMRVDRLMGGIGSAINCSEVVLVCVADFSGVAIWKVCGMRRVCQGASGSRR